MNDSYDVLVVGGGPARRSAALYLARYDRSVALFDAGHGRSTYHQVDHNFLGFPGAVPIRTLRELTHQQLADYPQATILAHKIQEMQRREGFVACSQSREWHGWAVILCMGVLDHCPHFEGWEEYVERSMFWCIACDGYECMGLRVVAVGDTTGIDRTDTVRGFDGLFEAIITQSGETLPLDRLFCQHGATPQSSLARDLGAHPDGGGYMLVDEEQKTRVHGVYSPGDVTRLHSHQVSTAVHEGGQAASAANYDIYPPELRVG